MTEEEQRKDRLEKIEKLCALTKEEADEQYWLFNGGKPTRSELPEENGLVNFYRIMRKAYPSAEKANYLSKAGTSGDQSDGSQTD